MHATWLSRLPAAADHAERRRAAGRARYRAATPHAAPVRSCPSLSASITASSVVRRVEKSTTTNGVPVARRGVRLQPGVAELAVDAPPSRRAIPSSSRQPLARRVLDVAAREPAERPLDRLERVGRREQLGDLRLGEVERHGAAGYCSE